MAYFSNSTEGDVLDEQCAECIHSDPDVFCPIALVQMEYNYDQLKKGNEKLREAMNILIDEKGECQMKLRIDGMNKVNPNKKCFQRKLVFGDEEQIAALAHLK